jgi:hypothetical protein
MDEETKRKKIQKYFEGFPWWTIVFIVLGLIVILIGVVAHWKVSVMVGVFLMVSGIVGIIASQSGKPSDNQIDDWLEFDRQTLITKSKAKLGLDESQIVSDPYEFFVWLWLDRDVDRYGIPDEDIKQKRGKVPCKYLHFYYYRVRHSAWRLQVFYPTEHYLASYGCAFDFLRGKFVREGTAEIYYKDITILETDTEDRIDLKDTGLKKSKYERFILKVSSGDTITIWIPSKYLIDQELKDSVSEIPSTQCEKVVQSMRKMIQPKKS